ncbi:hypothetical protein CL618_03335 [archaeon]|nr:hypothetical protein [archaeon]|tara:strand:- start:755 stop:1171 length:417 start_codon:yes stop_codon:yes gene_type:complete
MNIVIDSNILFSALIKDSITRKIILISDSYFLFPLVIFEEMEKYKGDLFRKSGMDEKSFGELFNLILKKIVFVPDEVLYSYREDALKLVEKIDINDVAFVASVLAYPNSVLWSDDKKLKKLKNVEVLNTKDIIDFLYS